MTPVQIFDWLLSGVTFAHGQLPDSVEKRLLNVSPSEMANTRTRVKAIPDMLMALRDAEFQLRSWLIDLSWDDDDEYTEAKREELESLISKIQHIFLRIR